jgi:Polysaccharide biosynthesis protein.
MGYSLYTVGAFSFSYALASLCSGLLLYFLIKKIPQKETPDIKTLNTKQELSFLLPSFLTWTGIAIISHIDIVIIKHNFDSVITGNFTQEAIIARMGLFITSALTMVLLPEISRTETERPKHLVRTAILISGGIAGMFCIICWTFPDYLLQIFFSSKASESIYLPKLSLIYALVAMLNLIFIINLGRGNYLAQKIYFIAILFFSIVLFVINLSNINKFIYLMITFLVILLLINFFKSIKQILN